MTSGADIAPSTRHTLCAAWMFIDAFSQRLITEPLDVTVPAIAPPYPSMPALPWKAVNGHDGVYRFLVTDSTVAPVGAVGVSVQPRRLDYASYEPLSMTLPRTLAGPYPQPSDFLIVSSLWPTRAFPVGPGETAIIANITSGTTGPVPNLRVTMWSAVHASPPAGTPYTYTDANGDFLFRLLGPDFRVTVSGGVVTTTANVSISLLAPPTYTTAVTPATPPFPQTVQLGQVNFLQISVP